VKEIVEQFCDLQILYGHDACVGDCLRFIGAIFFYQR